MEGAVTPHRLYGQEGRSRVKTREEELEAVLNDYIDILNADGAESRRELEYLAKYADDSEAMRLLRGARAVKALFEAYGDFPDLGQAKGRDRKPEPKPL